MIMTASKLRQNIYNVLDRALETGIPVEIQRKGKILRIVPTLGRNKLANLKKHDVLKGDPQGFVHMNWSNQWKS
jgi:antitoxin (DNA-binding transcriptional repressor) of toxin-antitoxin stability system